jgi:1,4-alpha-glucan branching enzyme
MKKATKKKATTKVSNTKAKAKTKPKSTQCSVIEGLKKQYLKAKHLCKVTFRLPKDAAPEAETVTLVGDFNGWSMEETPMQKLKSGDFKLTLDLECAREYRFKYLIDSNRWENDWCADKYAPNEHGGDDSVVIV